uniref:Uveal autoantigen with coiled-coil domains and ankyrin repeats n=1 Tax=Erpetoichthys calabaricus TaxID=27687 RepID=A0A8C4TT72_ERPCA
MKSLKSRLKKNEVTITNTDWNKYDDRLMKAVERGEVDKVAATLSKKGVIPTKLDVEGRSAFHLAASRGNLDCLNVLLNHQVDITAADATGKNALHLAARNGQSLCVQKLLQHNCPVGNMDLQGRTALHDAVIADCCSSVKLLCDAGASVNVKDWDGRTPLMLATQMCHPRICELLLERGAEVNARDKQNKTALIIGCEFGCKDAVEILLRNGSDVTLLDFLGHDPYYYARNCKNQVLLSVVKVAHENAIKAREAVKKGHQPYQVLELPIVVPPMNIEAGIDHKDQRIKDLELENEDLKGRLRKFHQEQRILLDKVNGFQQQLNQERKTVEDLQKERDHLKVLLLTKEKENLNENQNNMGSVKESSKRHEEDLSVQSGVRGKDLLKKQSKSFDAMQLSPSRSMSRPLELSTPFQAIQNENETIRKDMELLRKRCEAMNEEIMRLKNDLLHKTQECKCLSDQCELTKRDSDKQVKEMEDALNDVQKRMMDSELKVKQLQAHVVVVKEHLNSQVVEDLKAQLQEVKTKYEGASAEVGRLRNHLKTSEKALEEYRKSEGNLVEDMDRMQKELNQAKKEKDEASVKVMDMESQLKISGARLAGSVPLEKFDNMKNLLTNAVVEKERQFVELKEDYDRMQDEFAELQKECNKQRLRATEYVKVEEYDRLKATMEEQSGELKRKLSEVTAKSQLLIKEVEQNHQESESLKQKLQNWANKVQVQYVPLKIHEELKSSLSSTINDLGQRLAEAEQNRVKEKNELEKLMSEKVMLQENVSNLQAQYIHPQKFKLEVTSLSSLNEALKKQLGEQQQRCSDKDKELDVIRIENSELKQSIKEEYVTIKEHNESKNLLIGSLAEAKREYSYLEKKHNDINKFLGEIKDENISLRKKTENLNIELVQSQVNLKDLEKVNADLKDKMSSMYSKVTETEMNYKNSQDEVLRLHKEIEAQKKELDTIQVAIQSKFVPLSMLKEKEVSFDTSLKDISDQLSVSMEQSKTIAEKCKVLQDENDRLKAELQVAQERIETEYISKEKYQEVQHLHHESREELVKKLNNVTEQWKELSLQKEELKKEKDRFRLEVNSLQQEMQNKHVLLEKSDVIQLSYEGTIKMLEGKVKERENAYSQEVQKVAVLQKELECQRSSSVMLAENMQVKEKLEGEVENLIGALEKEKQKKAEMMEEISSLQTKLLNLSKASQNKDSRNDSQISDLRTTQSMLEAQVIKLSEQLSHLTKQHQELSLEALHARSEEQNAKSENTILIAKKLSIEQEIKDLKEKYDKSLETIGNLQVQIQNSTEQTEAKNQKITELLTDVERLKQALNGLSQLTYTGGTPPKRQFQQVDVLQAQIKSLQQQLDDAERRHTEVVSIYRTHLLSAAQGHMDEDVQNALLQIIRMRQNFVC